MSGRVVMCNGYNPPPRGALVLMSGLDSVAAAWWAAGRYGHVVCLGFAYGQPNAELAVAQDIAERNGWGWVREIIPGIGVRASTPGRDEHGVSRANVAFRNGILLSHSVNVAKRLADAGAFPGGVAIVVGCNLDDSAGFPDCDPEFLAHMGRAMSRGAANIVNVRLDAPWAPWLTPGKTKAEIIRWAAEHEDPRVLADIRYAVSCYDGTRCGVCDACTLRARSFAGAGVEDGTVMPPAAHGGDPAREVTFK